MNAGSIGRTADWHARRPKGTHMDVPFSAYNILVLIEK
jgi:hypothetical protein